MKPQHHSLQVNKKSRVRTAGLLSIVPGLGQIYNKQRLKGICFLLLAVAFGIVFYDILNIGFWGLATLGTLPGVDDSRTLIGQGIVAVFLTMFAVLFYILNIKDARKIALQRQEGYEPLSIREGFRHSWDKSFPYVLITPGLILLFIAVIFPLLFMIVLAFTNYNLFNAPPRSVLDWVGFQNFVDLATIPIWRNTFFSVLSWTIVWTAAATTSQIALAMFLAVIVNDKRIKYKRLIRTVLILPWAVPSFVTILIFAALFNDGFGAINRDLLEPLFNTSIPWLTDPFWTKIALIMIQTWLGFPFVFALFTGILQSVSDDWYEAADMDGASRFQKFRFITMPHVLFATAPLLIMQYAGNFNNFNIIYLFNEGGPPVRGQNAGGTDILISWVYSLAFENSQYSMAAAISIIIGLIVAVFAIFQFRKSRTFKEGE
ncbi:carbohydrate ABC transporter permease [Alkalicoccobacillus murimartini]|uniref:Maltose/maltodextrin transport system permease protein n=1 Tax=Alkalicoccobacillus murimartini TaxID=171685 RepID=A0ABT9YMF9_9BACI|nr:sugar ABC transporter permease [Alkalicoccobacillus murimartini]MDQ0208824.1 arabinogalactan oligomer/maltooligosaccharide transport system permease protein [Alkalicoccobacillus murimartini]